ncbi:ribose-phosphate diphosphokinase [Candidatus Vidania fulgoroideorum]
MLLSNKNSFLYKKIKKRFKNNIIFKKKIFNNKELQIIINKRVLKFKKVNILITFSKNINNELIEMLMVFFLLIKKKIKIKLLIPYFPYCRQDKKEKKIINCISFFFIIFLLKKFKIKKVVTIDLHTNLIFNNYNINFKNIKTICFIKRIIKKIKKKITLVFTDFGCFKRYFDIIYFLKNFLIIKKKRKKNKIFIKILYKKKIKKNILIIDDIIDSGNTILKIIKLFKNKSKNFYIYATHIVNTKSLKKFKNIKIFTTDTIINKKKKNIKIYSVNKILK